MDHVVYLDAQQRNLKTCSLEKNHDRPWRNGAQTSSRTRDAGDVLYFIQQ